MRLLILMLFTSVFTQAAAVVNFRFTSNNYCSESKDKEAFRKQYPGADLRECGLVCVKSFENSENPITVRCFPVKNSDEIEFEKFSTLTRNLSNRDALEVKQLAKSAPSLQSFMEKMNSSYTDGACRHLFFEIQDLASKQKVLKCPLPAGQIISPTGNGTL